MRYRLVYYCRTWWWGINNIWKDGDNPLNLLSSSRRSFLLSSVAERTYNGKDAATSECTSEGEHERKMCSWKRSCTDWAVRCSSRSRVVRMEAGVRQTYSTLGRSTERYENIKQSIHHTWSVNTASSIQECVIHWIISGSTKCKYTYFLLLSQSDTEEWRLKSGATPSIGAV